LGPKVYEGEFIVKPIPCSLRSGPSFISEASRRDSTNFFSIVLYWPVINFLILLKLQTLWVKFP